MVITDVDDVGDRVYDCGGDLYFLFGVACVAMKCRKLPISRKFSNQMVRGAGIEPAAPTVSR